MEHLLNTNKPQPRRKAFTIVELLVVIAVIAVLAGIFFGVGNGVRERAKISRAQSDLVLLAQYLEQYKGHYGDYPRVELTHSNSAGGEEAALRLYNALNGMRGVSHNDGDAVFVTPLPGTSSPQQRAFIDLSKFNYAPEPTSQTDSTVLLDPWGNAYRYYYAPDPVTTTWEKVNYVLYSMGPSGDHEPLTAGTDGYPSKDAPKNLDNIYAN